MGFLKHLAKVLIFFTLFLAGIALMLIGIGLFVDSILRQDPYSIPIIFGREQMISLIIFFSGIAIIIVTRYAKNVFMRKPVEKKAFV